MSTTQEKKRKKGSGFLGLLCSLLLTAVPIAIFFYTCSHYYRRAVFYYKGNFVFVFLYAVLLIALMEIYRGYKLRQSRTRELIFAFALSSFFADGIMYLVMCLIRKMLLTFLPIFLMLLIQWVVELALYVIIRMLIDKIEPRLETLYVYNIKTGSQETIDKLNSRRSRFHVSDAVADTQELAAIKEKAEAFDAVVIESPSQSLKNALTSYCFLESKVLLTIPEMTDIIQYGSEASVIDDGLFYSLRNPEAQKAYSVIKRAVDILLSFVGLVITSPIMLVVSIMVKKYDGGPAFYKQIRLTKDGREFKLVKFRSMVVNAEQKTGAIMAGKKDDRITPVGRFIRACRMDELPQLWNIFVGDMSIVGPRPERPEFYKQFCEGYPEFAYRLKVKAGLTGYAQLFGKYNTTFIEKAKLDMYYIQHESLFLDLQLIFYTLKILFSKESTEGVEAAEQSKENN